MTSGGGTNRGVHEYTLDLVCRFRGLEPARHVGHNAVDPTNGERWLVKVDSDGSGTLKWHDIIGQPPGFDRLAFLSVGEDGLAHLYMATYPDALSASNRVRGYRTDLRPYMRCNLRLSELRLQAGTEEVTGELQKWLQQ